MFRPHLELPGLVARQSFVYQHVDVGWVVKGLPEPFTSSPNSL